MSHLKVFISSEPYCIAGEEENKRGLFINSNTGIVSCIKCGSTFRGKCGIMKHLRCNKHNFNSSFTETKEVSSLNTVVF